MITNETFHLVGENFIEMDPVSSTDGSAADDYNIKFYPNPFVENITFEFSEVPISSAQPLSFSLFDLNGRLLRKEFIQGHSFTFHSKNLANGMYLFRIENRNELISSGKLIIGR